MREVKVIPSKSDAHRAMICAALAEIQSGLNGDGACKIICDETSKDMDATAKCLEALKEALSGGPGASEQDSCGGVLSIRHHIYNIIHAGGKTSPKASFTAVRGNDGSRM